MDNIESLVSLLARVATEKQALALLFYTPAADNGSDPCQQVIEAVEALKRSEELPYIVFVKVDASNESCKDIIKKYKVKSVPCVLCIDELGNEIQDTRLQGADIPAISKVCKQVNQQSRIKIDQRIDQILNASKIVLFIKGSKDSPKCKFSREIIQLLQEQNVPFDTYDILQDLAIREHLKVRSNWPTYPQLYASCQLIGGVDVVKELIAMNELQNELGLNAASQQVEEPLNAKLERLINQQTVMVFMKGSPDQPQCGFSSTCVKLLRGNHVDFGYFDILQDMDVRQGLKEYSKWPTFPQVYSKGELIGGLDVLKELAGGGEDALKKELNLA